MRMHLLSGGRLRMRRSVYVPDAERGETIDLPVSCALVRHARGNVLFDTGCHPSVVVDAQARWGAMAKAMVPIGGAADNVVDELARLGLAPGDVDVVVCSHFHADHCGCNAFFPRSTLVCHRLELEAASADDALAKGYLPQEWNHGLRRVAIDGEHDLLGDGRLVLKPLPGHTPGMIGALVHLDRDGSFMLASDAVPLALTLERDALPRNTADPDAASRSLDEVRRMQASGVTVVYGHDAQQWATLRTGAAFYE
jgi:N-acyl homoserine lactone hydrolase